MLTTVIYEGAELNFLSVHLWCVRRSETHCEDRSNSKRQGSLLGTLRQDWTAQFIMRALKWFLQCGVISMWVLKLFLPGKEFFRFVFRPDKKGCNSLLLGYSPCKESSVEAGILRLTTKPEGSRLPSPLGGWMLSFLYGRWNSWASLRLHTLTGRKWRSYSHAEGWGCL